ncbi:MAG: SGNH/GDSL hydrolase family protein [Actinobacteria bacterium]|nr:SGNH/GDSL hydrolase family protein [Actinomycetota bacterium]MBI3686754.1 SGNH/GDSL hydrolase family protein [Actinomycetota bacterium]
MARAPRVTRAARYGGGVGMVGVALLGALLGVLLAEAKLARRWVGTPDDTVPDANGTWGHGSGEPIRLAVLGDSGAAGFGVAHAVETPAALIATGVSAAARRPVTLASVAAVGATAADLGPQLDQVLAHRPQVAVILIGANDVKRRVPPAVSVQHLAAAVLRLREAGAEIVVGTCPDLGTVRPLAQPLRALARRWSRRMAAAQTIAVVEAGGRAVSLGEILGPEFAARPAELFGADRFHPSAEGYAAAAAVLLPSVCAAIGLVPEDELPGPPGRRRRIRPVARAAAQAASHAGTEVTGARLGGRDRGPWGRWARLRRRRPSPVAEPAADDFQPAG